MYTEFKNGGYLTAFIIAVTIIGFLSGALTIYTLQGADVKMNTSEVTEIKGKIDKISEDINSIKISLAVLEAKEIISQKNKSQTHKSD